jgi:MoxR-like ATPase
VTPPRPTKVDTQPSQDNAAPATRLRENVEKVVLGKDEEIALVLAAMISGGHVLLEDVPGTAKTILARSIAQSIDGAEFSRIQCTPDLQPTDVTGLSIYDPRSREFEFRPGPVFANILLVDEINRAMPKTQSALLEAMAEQQVTIDRVTRPLPAPFLVIATENPIEQEGTFPLPEAQLDRFAIRTALGYPDETEELEIVLEQRHGHPLTRLEAVVSLEEIESVQAAAEDVYVDQLLARWIVDLVRARALLHGRSHVVPDDVDYLFLPVIAHRILLTPSFAAETRQLGRVESERLIKERCLALAPPPAPDWHTAAAAT